MNKIKLIMSMTPYFEECFGLLKTPPTAETRARVHVFAG